MDALKVKYEQNRAEVLKQLDVSSDLLDLLTRHGLIDIADCVKYRGIYDTKKRNGSLMKTMVERRTDHAYPLFIQSLRQAGQESVANLLTDIGEETRILTHLQSELEHEIVSISDYLKQEERRSGITSTTTTTEGQEQEQGQTSSSATTTTTTNSNHHRHHDFLNHPPPPPPTSDREVWVGVQATLKRAGGQLERCRAVIGKLHQDCQELAEANGDMVGQIRGCYSRVKKMLRQQPSETSSSSSSPWGGEDAVEVPKSTQAMFQSVIDDVEKLMNRKSKAQQLENEGRTTAMRMLRHLRDWIQERSSILDTLHATTHTSPRAPRLPLLSSRRGGTGDGGYTPTPSLHARSSSRQQTPSPTRSQTQSDEASLSTSTYLRRDSNPTENPSHSQPPTTTDALDPNAHHHHHQEEGEGGVARAVHVRHVVEEEPHAISTVLEGLSVLERQVRQYVHMEILLTDKFRAQARARHLRKKSHGYSPRGLEEARRALDRLESGTFQMTNSPVSSNNTLNGSRNGLGGGGGGGGGGDSRLYLIKLRASLDVMCEEYSDCVHYMTRVSNSLVKIPDVDDFLAYIDNENPNHHHHKHHHHHRSENKQNNKNDKDRKNRQASDRGDKSGPASGGGVFSFFTRKKPDPKPTHASGPKSHHSQLPAITATSSPSEQVQGEDSLLLQLKQLVANYEMVKQKLTRLEDRFRREYDHKRRAFDASVRDKDEEIRNLQLRLKETEAEKDKFRGLYDKMKVAFAKRR